MGTKAVRYVVESAVSTYLSAQTELAGVNIYKGDTGETAALPKAIVLCESAGPPQDFPQGLGNYDCTVKITLFTSADDETLATHRARVAAVDGAMQDVAALQAVFVSQGDGLCYDVTARQELEGTNERSWASQMPFSVLVVINPQP
jgi:hypothetical protein